MKTPTTFDEQLNLLKSRGLIIQDENKCREALRSINYYRLSAYLLPFKQCNDIFYAGTTFEQIFYIYEFDRKLRTLLLSAIEEIELFLRTQLAYYSAHTYGALGYLDENNYNKNHNHLRFLEYIENSIKNNKSTPVVKHHNARYGGNFPIWVIVDFFSIGNLSYFYSDWPIKDKKYIAKELFGTQYPYVDSWMKCITVLRNRCAHYSRLYYSLFTDMPKIQPSIIYNCSGRVFDQLYVLKFLYTNKKKWNNTFLLALEALIEEYQNNISFGHIGFPSDWKQRLVLN